MVSNGQGLRNEIAMNSKLIISQVLLFTVTLICMAKSDSPGLVLSEAWDIVSTSYPKYDHTTNILKDLEQFFPKNVKIYSIGKTTQNREMWVIKLGEDLSQPRPLLVPKIKIVANMHGDETLGRALALMLAMDILKKKDSNHRVKEILKTTEIHLLPSMNPDGFEAVVEGNCYPDPDAVGRTNANKKDLNRDFPDQFVTKERSLDKLLVERQPETQNVMKWIKSSNFILSANLHALKVVASYPYDSVPLEMEKKDGYDGTGIISYSPDHDYFFHLATTYANNHKTMRDGCVPGEFKNGVTNGAEWYNVRGGMQDFNYVHSNTFEITLELSCCKVVPSETLRTEWDNNKEALYKFIEAAQYGVKGIVSDEQGKPIKNAKIHVDGIDHPITTNSDGEYWRLLLPGKYKIQATHGSYKPSERLSFVVPDEEPPTPAILDITMFKSSKHRDDDSEED